MLLLAEKHVTGLVSWDDGVCDMKDEVMMTDEDMMEDDNGVIKGNVEDNEGAQREVVMLTEL